MTTIHTNRGRDLSLKGKAERVMIDVALPKTVGVQPPDFRGLRPRVLVKAGDEVKIGTPLIYDKAVESVKIVSPACGRVAAVNRGHKRALINIVIETDGRRDAEMFGPVSADKISGLSREEVKKRLLDGGMWPALRQRPFSHIAHPNAKPKSIFVHAMNTEPLAPDIDFLIEGREREFQAGLDILTKLTDGPVHLCVADTTKLAILSEAKNVTIHYFCGSHPTGNVSTHIHYVDPVKKGDVVWYIEAWDVIRIARLFLEGKFPVEKIVAVTGETAAKRYYARVNEGAPLAELFKGTNLNGARCISGSVLAGRNVGSDGFVGFYHNQVTAIPEGGKREFLGWLMPGFDKYTLSRTYLSALNPGAEYSLDTGEHGGHRAIVLNHIYDDLVSLEILTYFLLKAILAGDIEEAEKLGILECDEEDFALCTFACPSKVDVGAIIRQGLDTIEKEG